MEAAKRDELWVGFDAGKGHHWGAAVDATGATRWSRKVVNDEAEILTAIGEIVELADRVHWAVDINGTASALLLALLAAHGQQVVYVPGRTVNRMSGAYRGEAKTDARDAYVIAETVRHRRDFTTIDVPAQLAADLALLTAHRSDLVADRVRMINRLRDLLTGICPALERAFDYSASKGALVLLTGYQAPAVIRRRGQARLTSWLTTRKVRSAAVVAATALEAAQTQQTVLPGESVAAQLVADLAAQILALDDRIKRLDQQIGTTFRTHPQAQIIESMPGIGPILGAELLVAAGDLANYADSGHLASAAGLVPVPRDSGRRTGNLHRPKRYSRRLRRVFYMSAQTSVINDGPNRDFYLKKRSEGCKHVQALIALARRRVDVLWALLRDNRKFTPDPPLAQAA
ncbi:IS110 family RNA-guided transposase [Streptacidiphilus rugosus]|uniref:IS110 family transposase n=1 Tax=Streptacidiphilus rugosus TaxID=405783 RepID=UPI00055B0666|nr:IS110 family transposase [Streptacidiphilus rugosus]